MTGSGFLKASVGAVTAMLLPVGAVIGAYVNVEGRREANYRMVVDVLDRPDANAADAARMLLDEFTRGCGPLGEAEGVHAWRPGLCGLNRPQRKALLAMMEAADASFGGGSAAYGAQAYVPPPPPPPPEACEPDASGPCAPQAAVLARRSVDPAVADLIGDVNDPDLATRRRAVAALEAGHLGDPRVVARLLRQLDPKVLDRLSVQGRYNVLFLLAQVPDGAWSTEARGRACAGLRAVETHAANGLGDQTRQVMARLDARIGGCA